MSAHFLASNVLRDIHAPGATPGVDADGLGRRGRRDRGALLLLVIFLAVVVATVGRPLVGLGSLHAADTMQLLDPWAQEADPGFRPDNGTVSDTVDAVAPVRLSVAERARRGDLALWSTTQGGGAPLLGVPNTAMLSPLNLPWWLAPGWWAPALAKALQMLVGGGFLFLLARRLSLSRSAALVGAVAFVNAGHLVVWTTWPQSNVAALVPALFWAVERAVSSRHWEDAWPVPLVGAVMWLEGFPALTLWAHVLAGSYAVVRLWAARRPATPTDGPDGPAWRSVATRTASTAAAMLVGAGVAAVQLVPFALRIGELDTSRRAAKAASALPWPSMATLVAPDAFGSSGAGVWYGPRNEVELQAFVGVVVVVLGVLALGGNRRLPAASRAWLGFATAAGMVVGALIWLDGPFQDAVQSLPLIGGNQTGRLRGLLAFLLATIAAAGHEVLLRAAREDARRLLVRLAIGLAVVVAALWPALGRAVELASAAGRDGFVVEALARPATLAVVAVAAVGIALLTRVRAARRAALLLVPLLLALEVTGFARGFLPRIDRDQFYPRTTAHDVVADVVGPDRFAAGELALYPGTTTAYGLRSVTAHAGTSRAWQQLLLEVDPDAYAGNATFPVLSPTAEVASSHVLDLLGASHFVTSMDVPVLGRRDATVPVGHQVLLGRGVHGVDVNRDVLDALGDHDPPVELVAWLEDEAGGRVASGSRRLTGDEAGEWLAVPLAPSEVGGPAPPSGRLVVALRLGRGDDALLVSVPEDLRVRPVRIGDHDLRVVAAPDVVVYERPDARPRVRLEDAAGTPAAGSVTLLADRDDELRVRVDVADDGTRLVVADALSAGHRARVDGRRVVPTAAHRALVGIPLPPGTHEVVLTWQPEGIRPAAAVTVASLLLVAAALWRTRRRGEDGADGADGDEAAHLDVVGA